MPDLIVVYDVETTTVEGRRRLRRVAQACEAYGQRVQWSVFECVVTDVDRVRLLDRISRIINPRTDSVRVYNIGPAVRRKVLVLGRSGPSDIRNPLVL